MEDLRANILLEVTDNIINEYPYTKEYIQRKLHEKCDREAIPIHKVILFF